MLSKSINKILGEFDDKASVYKMFGSTLQSLISDLLEDAKISVHSVTSRAKERDSLRQKLSKSGAHYKSLTEVTDLCGVRIISYFDDDVKRVADLIEAQFDVDKENSINKSQMLDPDRFGYLSNHYVVSHLAARELLPEYRKFAGLKVEIQVRSILQHAWAEIEHDLGYKSREGIPREVRRRFSRLAGLLELADQEFRTIRNELSSYSGAVSAKIDTAPAEVELDAVSLGAFIGKSEIVARLDQAIVRDVEGQLESTEIESVGRHVIRLNFLGIRTAAELERELARNEMILLRFAGSWLRRDDPDNMDDGDGVFPNGVCIFYLCYVLALDKSKPLAPVEYTSEVLYTNGNEEASRLAHDLATIYASVNSNAS